MIEMPQKRTHMDSVSYLFVSSCNKQLEIQITSVSSDPFRIRVLLFQSSGMVMLDFFCKVVGLT